MARNEERNHGDGEHRLPESVRQRNRAVAEREASRLARPEPRRVGTLGHASRKKSAVSSTPSGYHAVVEAPEEEQEWCGPFSVARQMIAKREEAKRKREVEQQEGNGEAHPLDGIMDQLEMEQKFKAQPSLQWKSNIPSVVASQNQYIKRQKRAQVMHSKTFIPSLFDTCVKFLVDNFEHVEALGEVDGSIRRVICEELVGKHKMNRDAFEVICETGMEALELIDCAEVTQDQLALSLHRLLPAGLRFLSLQHSGRCFGSKAVTAITSSSLCQLFAISIGGAYLLKDDDAGLLITKTAPTLSSIEFTACPLLKTNFCKSIRENYNSSADGKLLELSLDNVPLTKQDLLSLTASCDALRNLQSLNLRQMDDGVDDEVVLALLDVVVDSLESIDLSHNHQLTDEALSGIRKCNISGKLRSVQLAGLKNLTEAGLEAFFTHGIEGLPSPPILRKLNLNCCDHEAVSDAVLELALNCCSMKRNSDKVMTDNLSSMGGLVYLGISGSSCTDRTMEALAATSSKTLKELDASFCPLISDKGLGYLVSKVTHQLSKIHLWGNAQITDEFLDGHCRVDDSSFEVVGAWMKQNSK